MRAVWAHQRDNSKRTWSRLIFYSTVGLFSNFFNWSSALISCAEQSSVGRKKTLRKLIRSLSFLSFIILVSSPAPTHSRTKVSQGLLLFLHSCGVSIYKDQSIYCPSKIFNLDYRKTTTTKEKNIICHYQKTDWIVTSETKMAPVSTEFIHV